MHSSLWLHSSSEHTLAESCCCGAVSCPDAEDLVNAMSEQAGELSVQALQNDALLTLTQNSLQERLHPLPVVCPNIINIQ